MGYNEINRVVCTRRDMMRYHEIQIMMCRKKCLLHPFYPTSSVISPKILQSNHWRVIDITREKSLQQLLCNGDTVLSANISVISDAATPCCGINYRSRLGHSVNIALESLLQNSTWKHGGLAGGLPDCCNRLTIPTLPVPEIKALSLIKLHTSGGRRNM